MLEEGKSASTAVRTVGGFICPKSFKDKLSQRYCGFCHSPQWLGDATSSEILVLGIELSFVIFYVGVCMYVHLWQEHGGQVDDTCVCETFHSGVALSP